MANPPQPPAPSKRPWYLALALFAAMSLGMLRGCSGLAVMANLHADGSDVSAQCEPQVAAADGTTNADDAARVRTLCEAWLTSLSDARARVFPARDRDAPPRLRRRSSSPRVRGAVGQARGRCSFSSSPRRRYSESSRTSFSPTRGAPSESSRLRWRPPSSAPRFPIHRKGTRCSVPYRSRRRCRRRSSWCSVSSPIS